MALVERVNVLFDTRAHGRTNGIIDVLFIAVLNL